jgi:hypothetical protein
MGYLRSRGINIECYEASIFDDNIGDSSEYIFRKLKYRPHK